MEGGDAENVGINSLWSIITFSLALNYQHLSVLLKPVLSTVSSCTVQWLNDNWCESRLSRTVELRHTLFACREEISNRLHLQTYFAFKWYISGHEFLIKSISTNFSLPPLCNFVIKNLKYYIHNLYIVCVFHNFLCLK